MTEAKPSRRKKWRNRIKRTVSTFVYGTDDEKSAWDDFGTPNLVSLDPQTADEELDAKLLQKLHAKVGLPLSEDSPTLLNSLTREQKFDLYEEFSSGEAASHQYKDPEYYVFALQIPEKLDESETKALAFQLKYCTVDYILQFANLNGISWLLQCIRYVDFRCGSLWNHFRVIEQQSKVNVVDAETGNTPFPGVRLTEVPESLKAEQKYQKQVQILCNLVKAIIAALHHPISVVIEAFFGIPDAGTLMLRILQWCPLSVQGDIFFTSCWWSSSSSK